ncbi:MAG: hypothetical protein OER88_05085, partial [Planctomycetota bacterium]|nr:hypothetical protein [Planctomycetota bacterium]
MNRAAFCLLLLFPVGTYTSAEPVPEPHTRHDFAAIGAKGTPLNYRRRGKPGAKPPLKDGRLQLLFGRAEHKTSAAFRRTAKGARRTIDASFTLSMKGQNEGVCFALLHTGRFDVKGAAWDPQPPRKTAPELLATPDWAEPNVWDSFAVGFDVRNPKDEDWFNENGNFYGRPEREISLHFAGRELFNRLCPVELNDGTDKHIGIGVAFVTGGAEVTVTVDETAVYERHFVPHLLPYEARVAFGAHGTGEAFLDDVEVKFGVEAGHSPPPLVVPALRKAWVKQGAALHTETVDLLPATVPAERIVLTVTYHGPMARDYWDRNAAVYVWDGEERFELARLITPFMLFAREYRYDIDVTDFSPLLYGQRKLGVMVGSNVARGFLIDATLSYYRKPAGAPSRPAVLAVRNLWNGHARFNQPQKMAEFLAAREIEIPPGATSAAVRFTTTGHGVMEFTKIDRR